MPARSSRAGLPCAMVSGVFTHQHHLDCTTSCPREQAHAKAGRGATPSRTSMLTNYSDGLAGAPSPASPEGTAVFVADQRAQARGQVSDGADLEVTFFVESGQAKPLASFHLESLFL
jgi:hypothetical protein